ncbi:MAG: hypothetical protein AAGK47_00585, partial [Bacteroidota bacterium]
MKQTHTFPSVGKWVSWLCCMVLATVLSAASTPYPSFYTQLWEQYSSQLDKAVHLRTDRSMITTSNSQTCTGQVRGLFIVRSGSSQQIQIRDGQTICKSDIGFDHGFFRIGTSGSLSSATYEITGAVQSSNTENHEPYDSRNFDIRTGVYHVRVRLFSRDNADGVRCDSKDFSFTIVDCTNNCDGRVTGIQLINSDGNGTVNITDGQTICKQDIDFSHGKWEISTSGHLESIVVTTRGAVHDDKLENLPPYNSGRFTIREGDYTVNVKVYSRDNADGVRCDDKTFTFRIERCDVDPCANAGGDSDNDGVCNNDDCRPNDPNISSPGDACNDGNPNTTNDRIQSDCSCRGTIADPCANAGGDSDNDGVCNNDDCQPNNPNFPATPGTACNDGNPNTTNDRVTADGCGCTGT